MYLITADNMLKQLIEEEFVLKLVEQLFQFQMMRVFYRSKNKFVWVSHVSFANYLEMNYKDIGECYNLKNFDTEIKNCFYRLELELKK